MVRGILHEPKNWLILGGDGKPPWPPTASIDQRDLKVSWLDTGTDLLVPAAEKTYQVKCTIRPARIIRCRHVTVERRAKLNPSTVRAMAGNLWRTRRPVCLGTVRLPSARRMRGWGRRRWPCAPAPPSKMCPGPRWRASSTPS